MIIDRYNATAPSGANKLPEFLLRPHSSLVPGSRLPVTGTFRSANTAIRWALRRTRGSRTDHFGPAIARTIFGDLNATLNVRQDYYGTGDLKANVQQQINLSSPIGRHIVNTLSYSNQHVNGLGNEPFTFDAIGGAAKNLQEVMRFFNGDVYTLTLQTGTLFNMMAQPVSYQLISRPLPGVTFIAGGSWTPGVGNGFDRTNVQVAIPLGRAADVQMSTFVDWKNKGRLLSKTIYLRRIFADCYEVRVAYNQDLKTVNVTVDLLAFPTQALNFG